MNTVNQQHTELWRVTRLSAKQLSAAMNRIAQNGATGSLTIHYLEGNAMSLEYREKEKSTQLLDKNRV